MNRFLGITVAVVALCGVARGQTKPATAPVGAGPSIDVAMQALKSGDNKVAVDFCALRLKALQAEKALPTDARVINTLHVQAVAFMRLGQVGPAADAFQRAYKAIGDNRTLLLNTSISDVAGKQFTARAIKNLETYARAHPQDEDVIDLWGFAIYQAVNDKMGHKREEFEKAYKTVDLQLEATRPGMHRWGTDWVDANRFAEIERQRTKAQPTIDLHKDRVRDAERRVAKAKEALQAASAPPSSRGGGSDAIERRQEKIDSAEKRLKSAMENLSDEQTDLQRAYDKLPKPSWTVDLRPVDPELQPE